MASSNSFSLSNIMLLAALDQGSPCTGQNSKASIHGLCSPCAGQEEFTGPPCHCLTFSATCPTYTSSTLSLAPASWVFRSSRNEQLRTPIPPWSLHHMWSRTLGWWILLAEGCGLIDDVYVQYSIEGALAQGISWSKPHSWGGKSPWRPAKCWKPFQANATCDLPWFDMPSPNRTSTSSCAWCMASCHLAGLCKFPTGMAPNTWCAWLCSHSFQGRYQIWPWGCKNCCLFEASVPCSWYCCRILS